MSKTQSRKSRSSLTRSLTIRLTPETYAQLVQRAGSQRNVSDVIRTAIRRHLDRQADVHSSQAYFTRTFQERLDQVDDEQALTHWYQLILLVLEAQIGAALLNILNDLEPSDADFITGPSLVDTAVEVIARGGGEPVRRKLDEAITARIQRASRRGGAE